ncbi:tetratricopeptide repeat protein [Candidatus Roizmanbacteria bacterium]|nr:tetratricopeptide repeat protein [Candidatus Roizmanbacteria bacterium]
MQEKEQEFSFKSLFIPFTTFKAIHWIIIIGFIVFANMLFNGFVWDDNFQITKNIFVQSGQYFYYFSHTIGPYYKPFMFFVYTIFFKLFHLNSFFYHFFQITLHIVNAIFIFLLFRHFSRKNIISFVLAQLFLVHPMNEETAVYIADYQDILFTFFGLAALLVSIKQIFKKYSDVAVLVLLLCSILSKETGILFVIMVIIFAVFFRKESKLYTAIYSSGAALLYFLIRFLLVGVINPSHFVAIPEARIAAISFIERLNSIPKIIYYYLTTFVYPLNLSAQVWYVKSFTFPEFFWPFIFDLSFFCILIACGVYLLQKKKIMARAFWFFFFWFCIGLLLHLQILPLDFTATTRWFYFPMVGLLGMLLIVFQNMKITNRIIKKSFIVILLILFLALAVRTMIRNTNWYSDITLFKHDLPFMENDASAQYNYGTALFNEGRYGEAVNHLNKATLLAPKNFQTWHILGIVYLHLNELDKAKICFTKEITLNKDLSMRVLLRSW